MEHTTILGGKIEISPSAGTLGNVSIRVAPLSKESPDYICVVTSETAHAMIRDLISIVGEPPEVKEPTIGEQLVELPVGSVVRFRSLLAKGNDWERTAYFRTRDGWISIINGIKSPPDFENDRINNFEYRVEYNPEEVNLDD